ncbi:hypothetical protein [Aeoliella mucimassa]|nr:hypothetical protein [Aeoliella mucimassa]
MTRQIESNDSDMGGVTCWPWPLEKAPLLTIKWGLLIANAGVGVTVAYCSGRFFEKFIPSKATMRFRLMHLAILFLIASILLLPHIRLVLGVTAYVSFYFISFVTSIIATAYSGLFIIDKIKTRATASITDTF